MSDHRDGALSKRSGIRVPLSLAMGAIYLVCSVGLSSPATADESEYNRFLFVRRDRRAVAHPAHQYTVVMATITAEGFQLRDVYTPSGKERSAPSQFLGVDEGKLYAYAYEGPFSIDWHTGNRTPFPSVQPRYYHHSLESCVLRYGGAERFFEVRSGMGEHSFVPAGKPNLRCAFAASPGHKRLACFEQVRNEMARFRLKVVDIETKEAYTPCNMSYRPPLTSREMQTPPFTWVDDHRIVTVRTSIPAGNIRGTGLVMDDKVKDWLAVADLVTGKVTDIIRLKDQGRRVDFLHPTSATRIPLIIDSGSTGGGRYCVDLEAKTLKQADTPVGVFQLRGGGYMPQHGLQYVDSFLHDGREVSEPRNIMVVCVSPDGKRIIWRAEGGDNRRSEPHVRYYDSEERIIRTVSKGWSVEPFLWFKSQKGH